MTGERCDGCGHMFHRDQCTRKGPSSCVVLLDAATGAQAGIACLRGRGPCPCPFGACHDCGAPVAGASTLPLYDGSPEVDIERGSAGAPDGDWAVRKLPDGTLACRPLAHGEPTRPGEWAGRGHASRCPAARKTA